MKTSMKRLVAIALSLTMIAALFVTGTFSASAEDEVNVLYAAFESPSDNPFNTIYLDEVEGQKAPYINSKIHKVGFAGLRQDILDTCNQFSFAVYSSPRQDTAIMVDGCQYVTFWLYCENADVLNEAGTLGVNINDGTKDASGEFVNKNNWITGETCTGGMVKSAHDQFTFTNGWNLVSYEVTGLSTNGISSLVVFFSSLVTTAEQPIVIDDIRFMNKAALDNAQSANLNEMIAAIPELDKLTAADGNTLKSCRKIYDNLSDDYKSKITDYEKLTASEEKIVGLQRVVDAQSLIEKIDALTNVTLKSLSKINTAERAYAAFVETYGEDHAAEITNYETLKAARRSYDLLKAADYINKIQSGEITETNSYSVESAIGKAKESIDELIADYGADIVSEVTNYEFYTERVKALAAFKGEVTGTYGDVNDDQKVDSSDALLVLQYSVQKADLNEQQLVYGDVDKSGAVDSKDALLILQKSVGKIEIFPAEAEA